VEAIHAVAAGKKYLSPEMAQKLALRDTVVGPAAADRLSAREFEVLRLLAQGQSIEQIAKCMSLNSKTVANHQSAIKKKLGADTAIQLLKRASQLGLD
jgi:two-component system, NarL family, invasion response regulator UvrY